LERVLGIGAFPVNWPIGNGFEFQGVYDRQTKQMHTCSSARSAANIARR
jgi:peptide chain release factor 3